MTLTITPAKLSGTVTPPPSKSQAHRALIAAALADGTSRVSNVALSQDIQATLDCLEELGNADYFGDGGTFRIQGMAANSMSPLRRMAHPHLNCGESGSTLRFLIPIALAVRGGGVFTGRGRLMARPQTPYFDIFRQKGIFYQQQDGVLTVQGLLTPGEYALPGNISSQFITGLLYALPLLDGDSVLTLTSPLESSGYVDMTLDALSQHHIQAANHSYRSFSIPGNQRYLPHDWTVEPDWSQAAFWLAARFLGNAVAVDALDGGSIQGDKVIQDYFFALQSPEPLDIDVSDCPDLVPPLAAMAALRSGRTTRLTNAARLRIKESDRLTATAAVLNALGADVAEGDDFLAIHGKETLPGGVTVDAFNDHRIAMMTAIAATRCQQPVTLTGADSVSKSYPGFWREYERLGGKTVCTT